LCQTFSHTTPHYPQLQHRGYGQQPSANLALHNISSTGTANWFPDTSENQHVTPDLARLAASKPYLNNDNLHVGDGKGLPIYHIGHTKIYTPHRSFTLSSVLHVLAIRKHLLSVQKFCLDNNIYFEFHPFVFYVKDLNTNQVHLSSQSQDGLYALSKSLLYFMSRISTPMKSFSQVRVNMVFILCLGLPSRQFLKPIGVPAFLLLPIYGIVN
jgi:hypothetical protein